MFRLNISNISKKRVSELLRLFSFLVSKTTPKKTSLPHQAIIFSPKNSLMVKPFYCPNSLYHRRKVLMILIVFILLPNLSQVLYSTMHIYTHNKSGSRIWIFWPGFEFYDPDLKNMDQDLKIKIYNKTHTNTHNTLWRL